MSKGRNRQIRSGSIPSFEGTYIKTSFAEQKPLSFSFKYLELDRGKFSCAESRGASFMMILNCLRQFSHLNRLEMGNIKNYHPIDSTVIQKHHLQDVQAKSPSGKVHQMGKKRTPERLVGFFENDPNNLFQVCILDLDHQVYPEH